MTSAAIYVRKSNEQNDRADEDKSVKRQEEHARAFALVRGWNVDDRHVFADDGIGGAEFARRPGFMRLMSALKPRPPFQVLIVSEQKSIGRESAETNFRIKELAQAGVEVVEYVHGRTLTPKNWIDKVTAAVLSSVDEGHLAQTRERVHEAMVRKAKAGHVTGGRVYGYRNKDVLTGEVDAHGRPRRSHVVREIIPEQAAVIRRVCEAFVSGAGYKVIAKTLNAERVPPPPPFKRRDGLAPIGHWAPSTIRTILTRDLYRGVIIYNRSRKRDDWHQLNQKARPREDWIETRVPELQIVSDALWRQVLARRKDTEGKTLRFGDGRISGRPPKYAVKNLLAGLARCGVCGGSMVVETSGHKAGRVPQYCCHRRRHSATCTNDLRIDADLLNEGILAAIEEHALTPEAIEQVILLTERDDLRERRERLEAEAVEVQRRIDRLIAVVESGGEVEALVERLKELQDKKRTILADAAALQPLPRLAPPVVESRLAEWRRLLRQSVTQGRAVLQRVIDGRITFWPMRAGEVQQEEGYGPWVAAQDGYRFQAKTRFDRLFSGVVRAAVIPAPAWLGGYTGETGLEHYGPEDLPDHDYGLLLERAARGLDSGSKRGKRLASPAGVEPASPP